jgi:3alpha(or 20beta)-hydroxysteroid dehydrogenase
VEAVAREPSPSPFSNYAYAVLTANALRTPDKVALTYCGERSFTYAELNGRVNRVAHALLAAGVTPGTRVASLMNETLHVAEVYLAQMKIGSVVAALNPYWPEDTVAEVVERAALEAHGRLDVLINNAGVIKYKRIEDMTPQECRRIIDINLVGQWLGVRAVIEPMRAAGGGSIINVSSVEGFVGAAGLAAYSASKFGVRGLTKAAARELGPYGIRVNSIHPGAILTAMTTDPEIVAATADSAESFFKQLPLARMGKTRDVTGLVVFLASDESGYCTGSEMVVDGGMITGVGY